MTVELVESERLEPNVDYVSLPDMVEDPPDDHEPKDFSRWPLVSLSVLSLFTFFMHFRPWGQGLLEDWDMSVYWQHMGFWGTLTSPVAQAFTGRPLQFFWNAIGFALAQGSWFGPHLVLGLLAALQVWAVWWALRPVRASAWLKVALAALLALHPWWDAGLVLRFVHAQAGILLIAIWLGAVIRYLMGGSQWWLIAVFVPPVLSLFSYQAPAASVLVGVVALAVVINTTWFRRFIALGVTLAGVLFSFTWTLVITPRITEIQYESFSGEINIGRAISIVFATIGNRIIGVFVGSILLVLLITYAAFRRQIEIWQAALLWAAVLLIPITALSFITETGWLQDPERISQPTGLTMWLIAVALLFITARYDRRLTNVASGLLAAVSVVAVLVTYNSWSNYERLQQGLLSVIGPIRATLPPDSEIVIEDLSGDFGRQYSLIPVSLRSAVRARFGLEGADVSICINDEVLDRARENYRIPIFPRERHHFPGCSQAPRLFLASDLGEFSAAGRSVRIFVSSADDIIPTDFITPAREGMPTEILAPEFWWWVIDDPESFAVEYEGMEFSGIAFEIWAPPCADTSATVNVAADGTEWSQEVTVTAAGRERLTVMFEHPVTEAQVEVMPSTPSCMLDTGDPRSFGPAFANPRLIG